VGGVVEGPVEVEEVVMKGQVSGRNGKVIQFQQGPGGASPKVVMVPTPKEIEEVARQAARRDVAEVAKVLGEKVAMVYVEEVKSAVLINALIEILVSKGAFTKEEFKALVKKRDDETKDRYVKATEAIRQGRDPASVILGEGKGEGG